MIRSLLNMLVPLPVESPEVCVEMQVPGPQPRIPEAGSLEVNSGNLRF